MLTIMLAMLAIVLLSTRTATNERAMSTVLYGRVQYSKLVLSVIWLRVKSFCILKFTIYCTYSNLQYSTVHKCLCEWCNVVCKSWLTCSGLTLLCLSGVEWEEQCAWTAREHQNNVNSEQQEWIPRECVNMVAWNTGIREENAH